MADNVIGIKFGVAGGKGFHPGSSGALIKEQLDYLANRVRLKVNVSQPYFKRQLAALKRELDKTLGNLNVTVKANVNQAGQGDGTSGKVVSDNAQQAASYESVIKTLERLYQTKAKLLKMPDAKNGAEQTVAAAKVRREETSIEAQLKMQLEYLEKLEGAESKRVNQVKEYKSLLEQAVEEERKAVMIAQEQSGEATPIAVAKLKDKAASLYTTNGFDKVIKRSKEAKKAADDFNGALHKALNQGVGKLTEKQVKELNTQFIQTQAKLRDIAKQTNTVGNKIREAFDSRFIQRIAQILLLTLVRALKMVYENVKEIDSAMTELKIITRGTAKDIEGAAKTITKSAQEIGASVSDLTKSASVYARLGYSLEEAQSLAKNTTIYSNITGVDTNEATTNITGAIKAYNISIDDIETTLDKFVWVGNKFAISQAEIGEAMNNAASSLKGTGNSIDEAMGILAAANASVQNISKSSTGVRTIAARISASEAELLELGEDAGDIVSTAKLHEQMQAFGVDIVNANGELRSTYDILNDLAGVWDKLTTTDQAAIGNMFAGNRQRNVFESIMNNWGDAQSVVSGISSSVGSLQEANEIYLDSIQGKTNQLKAVWEEFSVNVLNSDLVKGFIDILSWLAKILNAVASLGDGVVGNAVSISAVVALVALAIQKLSTVTVASFSAMGKAIGRFLLKAAPIAIMSTIIALMTSVSNESKGTTELIVGLIGIIVSAVVLGLHSIDTKIKLFQSSNPIGWILTVITASIAIMKAINDMVVASDPAFETLKERAQESANAWESAQDELDGVTDRLSEIQKKIDDLNSKKLNIVDAEELRNYNEELARLKGESENEKSVLQAKQDAADRAKAKAAEDAHKALEKYDQTRQTADVPWWEWLLLGPWGFIHQGIAWNSDTNYKRFNDILADYQNASEDDKNFAMNTLAEYSEILENFQYGDDEQLDEVFERFYLMLDKYNLKAGHSAQTWSRVLADSRFAEEIEELQKLADSQVVSMDGINEVAPKFIQYLADIGMYSADDAESANALVESIKEMRTQLAATSIISFTDDLEIMKDKFDSLSNALDDIESKGIVTMDNISKIIDKDAEGYPELLEKYFRYVEGVGYKLAEAWTGASKTDILTAMAKDEIQRYADTLKEAQDKVEGMSEDNEDYETAVENVATAQENLNTKTTEWAALLREQALEDETDRLEELKEALEAQGDKYKDLIDIRKDLLETYKDEISYQKELAKKQKAVADLQTQLSLAKLDNSASGQAQVRELQEKLDEAKDELDEYTLEKAIEDLTNQLDEDYDAYKAFLQEQVDRLIAEIDNLASSLQIDLSPNSGASFTVEQHHGGGFVGNVVSLKSNEEFAKLLSGELVLTPRQMDSFMRDVLPNTSVAGGSAVINNNSPLIEIKCSNIDKDTLPQLRTLVDQAVAKIERNMTTALTRTGYKKTY